MYEELIAALREEAEWAEDNEWETPIMLSDHLKQAADVIEELSKRSECPCWYGGIRFCSMLGKPIPELPKEESHESIP